MAQVTKFTIDPNLSGIQLRTQASEMLTALSTLNSGDLEPVNPTGGMLWLDTTKNILKIRDKTNTAWLDFAKVNNNVLAANATDNSTPNTLVSRNADGDFKGRRVTAGNFLTTEKAQDDAIDENSEICYRAAQSSEAEPKQMRFATLGKIISMLKVEAATEAKAGIVKIKKQIGNTPTDDVVPTEKAVADALAKGFSNSKLQNGYTKLPNGIIMQWGIAKDVPQDQRKPITFPIAFPNSCLNASATYISTPEYKEVGSAAYVANIKKTGLEVEHQVINPPYEDTIDIYWLAIGY